MRQNAASFGTVSIRYLTALAIDNHIITGILKLHGPFRENGKIKILLSYLCY